MLRSTKYHALPLFTTKYYSSTTRLLLCTAKNDSVLQSTVQVRQSTTPVPQSTIPALICTAKHHSSTTPCCDYFSTSKVLQSRTLVLLCTAKYYFSSLYFNKAAQSINSELQNILIINFLDNFNFDLDSTKHSETQHSKTQTQSRPMDAVMTTVPDHIKIQINIFFLKTSDFDSETVERRLSCNVNNNKITMKLQHPKQRNLPSLNFFEPELRLS